MVSFDDTDEPASDAAHSLSMGNSFNQYKPNLDGDEKPDVEDAYPEDPERT